MMLSRPRIWKEEKMVNLCYICKAGPKKLRGPQYNRRYVTCSCKIRMDVMCKQEEGLFSWLTTKYVKIHRCKCRQQMDQTVQFTRSLRPSYPVYLGDSIFKRKCRLDSSSTLLKWMSDRFPIHFSHFGWTVSYKSQGELKNSVTFAKHWVWNSEFNFFFHHSL